MVFKISIPYKYYRFHIFDLPVCKVTIFLCKKTSCCKPLPANMKFHADIICLKAIKKIHLDPLTAVISLQYSTV